MPTATSEQLEGLMKMKISHHPERGNGVRAGVLAIIIACFRVGIFARWRSAPQATVKFNKDKDI